MFEPVFRQNGGKSGMWESPLAEVQWLFYLQKNGKHRYT